MRRALIVAGSTDPPDVEKLQQLLARAVVVPGAVAFDGVDELSGRLLAPGLGVEGDGEIETRLMIAGIGRGLALQLGYVADGAGLSGELQRCSRGDDRIVGVRPAATEARTVRRFEIAGGDTQLRQSGDSVGIVGVFGHYRGVEFSRPLGVAGGEQGLGFGQAIGTLVERAGKPLDEALRSLSGKAPMKPSTG